MSAYSIGYIIGQWMVEIVPTLLVVAWLAIIGPTATLILFVSVSLLAMATVVFR